MKRFILVGLIIIGIAIFFLQNNIREKMDSEREADKEELTAVQAGNKTDVFDQLPAFEKGGKRCKTIGHTIERGDCFQQVNAKYMVWFLDKSKQEFYFPVQSEQQEFKDILFYTIDGQDNLDQLEKTPHYNTYVNANKATFDLQAVKENLEEYWRIFSEIIPREYRTDLTSINFRDTGGVFGFWVTFNRERIQDNILMISHNMGNYTPSLKYQLIHEFGHVLTINKDQVNRDKAVILSEDESVWNDAEKDCPTYFAFSGCSREDSYINQYYQKFWSDTEDEYSLIDWDDNEAYENFFHDHEDHFFNSYQGTEPEEDIAEAFTWFVMSSSKIIEGKEELKYDKLAFFYQYDELIELRTKILENIYDLSVEDGRLY